MADVDYTPQNLASDEAVELAYDLIAACLPENVKLTITETDGYMIDKFLVRVVYTSHRTGRTISVLAKGNSLPTKENNLTPFYTSQLLTTPAEINRKFSYIAWLEKTARQSAWLAGGKLSNERIISQDEQDDMIPLPYNEEGATYESF